MGQVEERDRVWEMLGGAVKEEKERPGGTLDREKQHGQHGLLLREEEEGCVAVFLFSFFVVLFSISLSLSLSLALSLSRSLSHSFSLSISTYSCKILSA